MPRNTRTISVFLVSPSDVSAEREWVARALEEWNRLRGRDKHVSFELIRWETSVSAGFGDDGQQIVNAQVGDDYDALIAIFWTRIGSETPRAESGSIEEYERALARYRAGEPIEIAFFFKDAPVELNMVDFAQAQGVRDLKGRLQNEGALFKDFRDYESLRFEINLLLDRLARGFSQPGAQFPDGPATLPSLTDVEAPANSLTLREQSLTLKSDDIGYIDVLESLEEHSAKGSAFLEEMTDRLNNMTKETESVSSEMEELGKLGKTHPSVMKPLIARVTDGMNEFSSFMESRGEEYALHSMGVAESARYLIDLARDFEPDADSINIMETNLLTLLSAMDDNCDSMESLLYSTEGLHRMTVPFNHARKRLACNLRSYLSKHKSSREVVREAVKEVASLRCAAKEPSGSLAVLQ